MTSNRDSETKKWNVAQRTWRAITKERYAKALTLVLGVTGTPAYANLCEGNYVESQHRQEAKDLENETYSQVKTCKGGSNRCFVGTRSYNEMIIGCNRKRDGLGKKLDDLSKSGARPSGANLAPMFITDKLAYFNVWPKKYHYTLERKDGTWIITSILDFKFPGPEGDKLHISPELMASLSKSFEGTALASDPLCTTVSNGKKENGLITVTKDGVTRTSCRVNRDARFFLSSDTSVFDNTFRKSLGTAVGQARPVTEWLMLSWRQILQRIWTRDGVTLKIKIANLAGRPGEITKDELDFAQKNDAVYQVELHHNEKRFNNMFSPVEVAGINIYKAIYTGENDEVVSHEFSHSLGLDDEYAGSKSPDPKKDCDTLSGSSDREQQYLMCEVGDEKSDVKSVYAWLVTQRYPLGKSAEPTCKEDNDCDPGNYCDKGTLTVGKNQCVPQKGICFDCSRQGICGGTATCQGTPLGKCIIPASVPMGGACCRDQQCQTGKCGNNVCTCDADTECLSTQYCKKGVAGIGFNTCATRLPEGSACTDDNMCVSGTTCSEWRPQDGQASGICYKPASKSAGQSCKIDLECKTGKCNSNKTCVCKRDEDCGSSSWCDQGVDAHQNSCKAKLSNGQVCGHTGEFGLDRRCKSGNCKAQKAFSTTFTCQ